MERKTLWFRSCETSRMGKSIEKESSLAVAKAGGGAGVTASGYQVSFWGNENVLEQDGGDVVHNLVNTLKTTGGVYTLKG